MPPLRSEIKFLLLALFWVLFSLGFFERFPLPGFFSMFYLTALGLVIALSAYGWGTLLVNSRAAAYFSVSESILFSSVSGFGILSLLMMAAGALALWARGPVIVLVTIGLLLALLDVRRHPPRFLAGDLSPENMMDPRQGHSGMTAFAPLFLIVIGALVSFVITFTPATYYDTLVYHFALPQTYIQAGRWVGETQLIYSAFPQMMEMIWTLGMLLAGDVLANLLGWILSVFCVWAVYCFAKRFFGKRTAAWAAAFLCVMPAFLLLSSGGYIDIGLALFTFMSFYALCLWKDHPRPRVLALAGVLAGCAMGTKYTGGISIAIGMLIIFQEAPVRTFRKVFFHELLYGGIAILVVSPWLLKNIHYVGDPVFPFCYTWNIASRNPWLSSAAQGYFRGLAEYAPRSGWHLLKLVWDIAVHGLGFGGGMDVLGDIGWALLFAFLPTLLFVKKKSPVLVLVLLYVLFFFIPWGMARPVLRFFMPMAPFLALASAYGYQEGLGKQRKEFRMAGHLFLSVLLLSNLCLFSEVTDVLSSFRVPLGLESREGYLLNKLNYFGAATFVGTLSPDSLTYVVGDQRGYYYNRPVLVTPVFNTNPLTEWANQAASSQELAARLRAQHVTHLLINYPEFKRLDGIYHLFPFTSQGQTNWNQLLTHLGKPLYHDRDCDVFVLPGGAS